MRFKTLLLLPVLLPQALWVIARATRLDEPEGPRAGRMGQGRPLRLLIVGDSSAAGVGAAHQDEALCGPLTRNLAQDHALDWRLLAKSGATTQTTLAMLKQTPPEPCDIALIALGVNDAKNGVSRRAWLETYAAILDLLRQDWGVGHIFVSGLPPVRHFPLLPWPLKEVLGDRADLFGLLLSRLVHARARTTYIPLNVALDPDKMASDGFHPGRQIYAEWAAGLARHIREELHLPILADTSL